MRTCVTEIRPMASKTFKNGCSVCPDPLKGVDALRFRCARRRRLDGCAGIKESVLHKYGADANAFRRAHRVVHRSAVARHHLGPAILRTAHRMEAIVQDVSRLM